MNKKAIFIPLLLLVIQPNKILGTDNKYDRVKAEIEKALGERARMVQNGTAPPPHAIAGFYRSADPDVNSLLELVHEQSKGSHDGDPSLTPYFGIGMDIIEKHYPNAPVQLEELWSQPLPMSRPVPRKPPAGLFDFNGFNNND